MAREGQQERGNDGEGRSFGLIWIVHGIQMSHVLVTGPLKGNGPSEYPVMQRSEHPPNATPLNRDWVCLDKMFTAGHLRDKHTALESDASRCLTPTVHLLV